MHRHPLSVDSHGVAPGRALFVGDSTIDVATARGAGVPVWLLPYGYNMGMPVGSAEADRVIAQYRRGTRISIT